MKIKTVIIGTILAIIATIGIANPAQAGNGCGRIYNMPDSVQFALGSLYYKGPPGPYRYAYPGQYAGGCGTDIDSIYIPANKITWVAFNGFGQGTFNQCGRGGFWTKVSDWGATIKIRNC